jgi:hypothetical protein
MERCPNYDEYTNRDLIVGDIGVTEMVMCYINVCPYNQLDNIKRCKSNGLVKKVKSLPSLSKIPNVSRK